MTNDDAGDLADERIATIVWPGGSAELWGFAGWRSESPAAEALLRTRFAAEASAHQDVHQPYGYRAAKAAAAHLGGQVEFAPDEPTSADAA